MATLGFLPIMIILFIVVGLFFLQRFSHHRGVRFLFSGYLIILLISLITFYLLPDNRLSKINPFTSSINDDVEINKFYEKAIRGQIEQLEDVKVREKWEFEISGDQLKVSEPEEFYTTYLFERKEENDHKVEIFHYASESLVDLLELKDKHNFTISLEDNVLRMKGPDPIQIKIAAFKKDFVINQFSSSKSNDNYLNSFGHLEGNQVIYIRVPKDIEISSPHYIQYVGEE